MSGTKIPEQYRKFLLTVTDGGEPNSELIYEVPDGSGETDMRAFYGIKPHYYSLKKSLTEYVPSIYPLGTIAIAEDGVGNTVLLVPQPDGSVPVGFWDHEDFEEMYKNPLKIKLADSFNEFLEILYLAPEE